MFCGPGIAILLLFGGVSRIEESTLFPNQAKGNITPLSKKKIITSS